MAFEDPAEEELDYDNDDALDQAELPESHAVLEDEDLDDDDDYEDLYGDVNVGMYEAPPVSSEPLRNAAQSGDVDALTENENRADGLKVELVPPRNAGAVSVPTPPKEETVEYDYLPDVKEETLYGDSDVGPSKPKVVSEQLPSKASASKGGKSVGGANGTDGGAGRGGWPAGSGPAGGQAGNAVAVANNGGGGGGGGFAGKAGAESGGLMLFVGELQWWTTDAELEAALSEYGRMRNLKFFEEKASGKSKGYCQVEFFEAGAARVCKDKMDGRVFNGRACVVAFASPQTIKQMGAAQVGKNQASAQQSQGQAKKTADGGRNGGGGGGGQGGDARGFGKGGRGQPAMERGRAGSQGQGQAPGRGGRGGGGRRAG